MTVPTKAPISEPNHKVERRNRDKNVIEAGITVFARRGYAATSVQEIADKVGVLKGSLYHYFSSKEELLFRILQESHVDAEQIMDEVAALGLDPYEELQEFLRRQAIWFLTNLDRAHIFFTEARHLTGERRKELQRLGREFVSHIGDLVDKSIADGALRTDIPAPLIAEYVVGALNSLRDWPVRVGKEFSKEEMTEAFINQTRAAIQL